MIEPVDAWLAQVFAPAHRDHTITKEQLAYAVLRHARSNDDLNTITAGVDEQITEHHAKAQRLRAAVRVHIERKRDGQGDATA